jgi:hypothetical protein
MPEPLKPPYIEKIDRHGPIDIWIVDGAYIRGHIDEEFTNFGQHYRYPYIPLHEFWLDREAHADETGWRVNGQTHWLWCFTCRVATLFTIERSRAGPVVLDFLKGQEAGGCRTERGNG